MGGLVKIKLTTFPAREYSQERLIERLHWPVTVNWGGVADKVLFIGKSQGRGFWSIQRRILQRLGRMND